MEDYKLKFDIREKIKKYDDYILSYKKTGIHDDILRAYLLENNLLQHFCRICHQSPTWNKKPLDLVLDRINNRSNDNRIENLRFICPNCLSQIKKKASIFQKLKRENIKECLDCGKQIKAGKTRYNKMECVKFRCKDCLEKKINIPMVYETNFSLSL